MLACALLPALAFSSEAIPPPTSDTTSLVTASDDVLQEVIVSAPEPRYVAPTRRDGIGRIWAPVYINDKGPFRLVLDTGASESGIVASVAEQLAVPETKRGKIRLRGVTGTAIVPTVRVDTMVMGDLLLNSKVLPVIPAALGGAEGILGTEGLTDKRVYIDFRNDLIVIKRSRNERAAPGFLTIPVHFERDKLLVVDAFIGSTKVKAIIDTGGQVSIGNLAARDAVFRRPPRRPPDIHDIVGATSDVEQGEGYAPPPIAIGDIRIRSATMTFGDMQIFKHWKLTDEPAVLIGMDVLGLLDTLIIDYHRRELQVRMRDRG